MPITHGTISGYTWHKCRCDDCRAANLEYSQDMKDRLSRQVVPDGAHGTLNGYNTYRCRCDDCREAMNAYGREYKRKRRAAGRTD